VRTDQQSRQTERGAPPEIAFAEHQSSEDGSLVVPDLPKMGALHWSSPRYIFQEGMVVGVDREE
jgi:hypothetical protein